MQLASLLLACDLDQAFGVHKDRVDGRTDSAVDTGVTVDSGPLVNTEGEACNGLDDDADGRVDEGWPDADANGRVDCLDASCPVLEVGDVHTLTMNPACSSGELEGYPLTDAWAARVQWQFVAPRRAPAASGSLVMPALGSLDDDDGDGAITADDLPEVVVNACDDALLEAWIVALDGETGAERWAWEGALATGGVAIADVTRDGTPDVLTYDADAHPVMLDASGRLRWRASRMPSMPDYPMISVADLDGDGRPEVIADDLVLDGATGATRFSLGIFGSDASPYRMAAIGDVDNAGGQELAVDGRLYASDGTLLWDSGRRGSYGSWPVLVNADDDEDAEIGFVGDTWALFEADGTVIFEQPYGIAQPGPPCAGDFDGDGDAEVAWPAYDALVMYELDGTPVWSAPITDASGLSGCSGVDLDGDGALEVLYADEVAFRILDGRTGRLRVSDGRHRSGTVFEYPVAADIDGDDHTEIVIASNGYDPGRWGAITVFEHAGTGWTPTGKNWGVHDFAITNVLPSGEVPAHPLPSWVAYNVYRARVAIDALGPPDLVVGITDLCVADCVYGPVQVAVQVGNQGGGAVSPGTWLSLYAAQMDGTRSWLGRWAMPTLPPHSTVVGFTLDLTPAQFGSAGLVAVIDDDGTGLGDVDECDETNNEGPWTDVDCE